MDRFIARFADKIIGVLSGFDRLVFRGTLRKIGFIDGMRGFLRKRNVLLKDFGRYAEQTTERVKEASYRVAEVLDRPVHYLSSSRTDKEAFARKIAQEDGIDRGLIALLTCVEPCRAFDIHRNREQRMLQIVRRERKCLHLYSYFIDPVFGFMNARVQTWFPFNVQICVNGREWLAREMDREAIRYERRENCFPWIQDVPAAQELLNRQRKIAWRSQLNRILKAIHPLHREIFPESGFEYYWCTYQSEWATDVMFRDAASLAQIYPPLVRHGITTFSSPDVMRFLGRTLRTNFEGEVTSSLRQRPEGVRIKHWVDENSIKAYDKQGSILRAETTINNPRPFKILRAKEGDPKGPRTWQKMRQGISDLFERTRLSQASNERYLDAYARVDTSAPVRDLAGRVCRPARWRKQRVRALQPWSQDDVLLLKTVARGEFVIAGFRNRDLQAHLYDSPIPGAREKRRRTVHVTRLIRMLRAHRLIRKLPKTHRYVVSKKGHDILPALLAVQTVTLEQLQKVS